MRLWRQRLVSKHWTSRMDASFFIASRLRFKGRLVVASVTVSYLVMIIALAVSSGFRQEIRSGLSSICGDIQLVPQNTDPFEGQAPMSASPTYLPEIKDIEGVADIRPVVYRAGIVKNEGKIHGVVFKGQQSDDTTTLGVSVPRRLAEISGLGPGDRMQTYFVGEKVKVRQFNIVSVYDAMVETDENLVVYASLRDIQRVNGWGDDQVSSLEIVLDPSFRGENEIEDITYEVGGLVYEKAEEDDDPVYATSTLSRYPQLFDWLGLIDFNVLFILVLMTIVAGFNMISGLLIMLFENISTIGLLKSLGMTDKAISKIFLSSSAVLVLKGMLIGNVTAFLFCVIQNLTHVLKLNPENYFVSFVPVRIDPGIVLTADVISFAVIMVLLLIPCIFISRVDPAETVRVR